MNEEDRRYLRFLMKRRPSLDVYVRMVEILTRAQAKTDQLLNNAKKFLLETYQPA